ncbi:hypothetical protein [Rubinisphaera italica]|uniref:DUF5009 domain-containing protein n=1 Tax=Rubinisphaera italica TaxID=2527969 RepID=A0A5C5XHM6_9PLAN|nr:hypothetical protein [Rubinisphaera italica]TWT62344.1 hypothetical protein Pan54_30850 [Rubinisphaera italica]
MTETYRLSEENPMGDFDEDAPALRRVSYDPASRKTERESTNPTTTYEDLRRFDALDLYRGLLLLTIVAGASFLFNFQLLTAPGNPPIYSTGDWFSRFLFNAQPSDWESLYGLHVITVRDYLLSGFLFAAGISLFFWKRRRVRLQWRKREIVGRILFRVVLLMLLGIFLQSLNSEMTRWVFIDPLTLIGMATFLTFLIARGPVWWQGVLIIAILIGQFAWIELSGPITYPAEVQGIMISESEQTPDRKPAWAKHKNVVELYDRQFLSNFPGQPDAAYRESGRTTFNVLPATVLMMLGMLTGQWFLSRKKSRFFKVLLCGVMGIILVLAGIGVDQWLCPAIERILSTSWVLLAGGYSLLLFSGCAFFCEVIHASFLFAPLRILGRNSLLIYLASLGFTTWLGNQLFKHAQPFMSTLAGGEMSAELTILIQMLLACLAAVLLGWFLNRRRFYVRV